MNKFINESVLSKNDIREINAQIYFKTPLYIVLYAVCILTLASQVADYVVNNVINLSGAIPFLLAILAMIFVFISNNRNMYNQSLDSNGNPVKYTFTAEEGKIKIKTNNGRESELYFKNVYKIFESKNCFALRGRDNSFYILRKDGFIEGDFETFKAEIKASL